MNGVCSKCGNTLEGESIGDDDFRVCAPCWEQWLEVERAAWIGWAGEGAPSQGQLRLFAKA